MSSFSLEGNVTDLSRRKIFSGRITVNEGHIVSIEELSSAIDPSKPYIIPGFIDSHVHIESSMLAPSEFARLAVVHGTVATVSDPHEIANVCGMSGIEFMINNGKKVNFKFYFGAPSCVPATSFETAGYRITPSDIELLLAKNEIHYLSEMMNFPGVIHQDAEVMEKISLAHKAGKPVDGHAPGLTGEPLKIYVSAGISTDHECFTAAEAREKLGLGMKILIREGSAAKNFEALADLLHQHPDEMMFCSDDKHPDSLVHGHINQLCQRAVKKGIDLFHVLKAACVNPVKHYGLKVGQLQKNDPADFIVVKDLETFQVMKTYINGVCVAETGKSLIASCNIEPINNFSCRSIKEKDLHCQPSDHLHEGKLPVIEALDGQLITNKLLLDPETENGLIVSDTKRDILKMVVVNRYKDAPPAIAFIKNFGLNSGAIASSVAHDSHNIIAVGTNDADICAAVNLIVASKGGISCVTPVTIKVLALPVAGLMSAEDGYRVAASYTEMDALAKSLGTSLSAPFMTLSFMGLLVIPSLKLSDRGLFDGEQFRFVFHR